MLMFARPHIILLRKHWSAVCFALLALPILAGCGKQEETISPQAQVVQYLVGSGNRVWRIKENYVNGVKQTLTTSQLEYTKTYTISISEPDKSGGTFSDQNNYAGIWVLTDVDHISETIQNATAGTISYVLTIRSISANDMDVEYTANGTTIRTVYYAY